jgi:hypothetical protein
MPNYQEKIHEFDGIVALCDQELESLRRSKLYQSPQSRKEAVEQKFSGFLSKPIFSAEDEIVQTWEKLKEGGFPISFETNLVAGYKEKPASSEEWYKSGDIFCILDNQIRQTPNVKFSNMILVGSYNHYDANYDTKKTFKEQFEEAIKEATNGKPTIMPTNLRNKHWVASMLRKNSEGKLELLYNDSIGAGPDSEMLAWIKEFNFGIEVKNLGCLQQRDSYNCGPYMIHNLLEMASNPSLEAEELAKKLGTPDPTKLREEHGKILREDSIEKDEAEKICLALKERAICGRMNGLFDQFREENRMEDGQIKCDNSDAAKVLAEQIKKSYEDIGVKPCVLESKGDSWVVRLPEQCRGRDPFSMSGEDLRQLKEEIKSPSAIPEKPFVKISNEVNQNQSVGL